MQHNHCLLCKSKASPFQTGFFHCPQCDLIFRDPKDFPEPHDEKARYETHQNRFEDVRYIKFLLRLQLPLANKLEPGQKGLDYGCGPEPVMQKMFEEDGFEVVSFDPFFFNETELMERQYDFISCSETAEHFHNPLAEFKKLDGMLKPGGWLGVMTGEVEDRSQFEDWHYQRDFTHVCFYSAQSFDWLAGHFGWKMEHPRRNVFLFQKP